MKFSTQAHHGWNFSFMLSKTNLKPLKSTPKAYFQPHESTFKGLNRISWNKGKVRIELLLGQLTSLQLFWWLPKIIFNPWEYFQSLPSPHESTSKGLNIALVLIDLAQQNFQHKPAMDGSSHPYCQKLILNPFRDLPKPIRASWKNFKAKRELLWDQLTSLQPFLWFPKIIFKITKSQLG